MTGHEVTTIMGLDPALTASGVARWRDGRLSTKTITTNPAEPYEARVRWICGNIWPLITRRTFVVLEAPYMMDNGKTSMMLAGLHYILRYGLYARSVPFGVVTPSELKQFVCGNGGADKQQMVAMATATFGPGANLNMGAWDPAWAVSDVDARSHEADALGCMTSALFHVWKHEAIPADVMEPGISAEQAEIYVKVANDWPEIQWEAQE